MKGYTKCGRVPLPSGDLRVFAYGSLLWRPGFDFINALPATVFGYHRSLCVWSWHHRGSQRKPGLVLGLDTGGSCRGVVFRVCASDKEKTARYLFERECVTPIYIPRLIPAKIDSATVPALTFTIDRKHPQYAGRLSVEQAASVVNTACGHSGPNIDYVANTVTQLSMLGISDDYLSAILENE